MTAIPPTPPAPVDPVRAAESALLLDELNRVLTGSEPIATDCLPVHFWQRRFRLVQFQLIASQQEVSQVREQLVRLESLITDLVERLGESSRAVPEARQVLEQVRDAVPVAVQELQSLRSQVRQAEAEAARWREAYALLLVDLQAVQSSRAWQTANWVSLLGQQLRRSVRSLSHPLRFVNGSRTAS